MLHAQLNGVQNLLGNPMHMNIQYRLDRRRTEIDNIPEVLLYEQRRRRNAQTREHHIGAAAGNQIAADHFQVQIVQILQKRIMPVELNIVQNLRQQLLRNLAG